MNRQQEFEAQLAQDNERVVNELLNNPEWEWLREFYRSNWDEIIALLKRETLRTVVEDFGQLKPPLALSLTQNQLFVYQVNLAIYHGVLTIELFK